MESQFKVVAGLRDLFLRLYYRHGQSVALQLVIHKELSHLSTGAGLRLLQVLGTYFLGSIT